MVEHLFAQPEKQVVFQFRGPFFRSQNLRLHGLQVLGDEALAASHCLLADVVAGHFGQVGLGDLNVIAEDGVESDLQRGDSGASNFVQLQLGQPVLAAAGRGAQFIEFGAEAIPDHPAFLHRQRRFVGDGVAEQFDQVR